MRQQTGVEEGFEAIERQVQGMQEKVGGFVPRIVGTMAEKEAGLIETADGKAHQVAQGGEFALGLFEEVGSHLVFRRLRKKLFKNAPIDGGELCECGDLDAFIDLVDAGIDRADLDDLRTYFREKAAIGCAASGR